MLPLLFSWDGNCVAEPPVVDHHANVSGDVAVRAVKSQCRALRIAAEMKSGKRIPDDHLFFVRLFPREKWEQIEMRQISEERDESGENLWHKCVRKCCSAEMEKTEVVPTRRYLVELCMSESRSHSLCLVHDRECHVERQELEPTGGGCCWGASQESRSSRYWSVQTSTPKENCGVAREEARRFYVLAADTEAREQMTGCLGCISLVTQMSTKRSHNEECKETIRELWTQPGRQHMNGRLQAKLSSHADSVEESTMERHGYGTADVSHPRSKLWERVSGRASKGRGDGTRNRKRGVVWIKKGNRVEWEPEWNSLAKSSEWRQNYHRGRDSTVASWRHRRTDGQPMEAEGTSAGSQ